MLCSPLMEKSGESAPRPDSMPDSKNGEQQAPEEERPSCPKCGSHDVRRSRGDGLMPPLQRMLGRWPFRCRSCRARFYRASAPPED